MLERQILPDRSVPLAPAPQPGDRLVRPPAVALDGGVEVAEEAAEGPTETGEGETAYATFPVPNFADLKPIAKEKDFLAAAQLKDGKLVLSPSAQASEEQSIQTRILTVDPQLQKRLTDLLKSYGVPYGAIAAIEPATGRVLALAEYRHDAPGMRGLPVKAVFPAASVFKTVTGAALLSEGVSPDESVCFHGGKRRLDPKLLEDGPHDGRCASFATAMGHSLNVIFGKLAKKNLDARLLRSWAEKFGFNTPFSFDEPMDVSVARIPEATFDMAKAAAGFGEVFLSPLHGAVLAGAIGNHGVMVPPVLFEGETGEPKRIMDDEVAATLGDMLELSVTEGTASRAFRERGRYVLGPNRAAGKTGSICDKKPFRDFTWFVGWAPREAPKIAVAAVVVNSALWRVRAPYLGREALRMYLEPVAEPKVHHRGGRARQMRTEINK